MPMGFLHHTFSDTYARRNNWLTRIDVRIKVLYVISFLAANIFAKDISVSLFFFSVSFALLIAIKIHPVIILRNMLIPVSLAVIILLMKGLYEGEKEWISFPFMGYRIIFKEEGLRSGILTFSKVLGGVSLVILFSFTTTISQLCSGLKWFRVPNTIIELLAFVYRYIFLLLDEVSSMWTAQRSRLGYTSWRKTLKSFGILGGMLIVRAFERAERTNEAMCARGYEGGGILTGNLPPWRKKEYLSVMGIIFILSLLMYTGNMQVW